MQNQPHPRCAYCRDMMTAWPRGAFVSTCNVCRRPLLLLPSRHRSRFKVLSLIDVAKVMLFPVIGGAIIAFGMGNLSSGGFARIVALMLLAWGVIDIVDGRAGIETNVDRVRRKVRADIAARRSSISKLLFGGASAALGAVGLILAS